MAGLGIYDYGARFYSPKLGRFLSPDTIVPGAGNPQAFNRYSYVLGNPLKYIDPSGHGQCQTKEDCADMGTTPMGTGGSGGGSTGGGGGGGGGGHHDDLPDPNPSCVGCEGYEQDAVDCSIQACIGVPDYWDLNLSHPDYYTLALSGSLATVTFTVDRYGHVYWAFGVSVNTSIIGGPPGISLMAGKIGQSILDTHNPIPDVNTIPSFLTGFAGSIDVGLGPAGGLTFSPGSEVPNNIGTVSTFAPQGGLSTPFAGGSVTYGIQFQNEAVNHAGQWLIQNVIMRSLP
jgi:RHS repeat-associated protein